MNSPENTIPSCPHFPKCGGCQSLDIAYPVQLDRRKKLLEETFSFLADTINIPDILPSPQIYNYRHKVQLPFGSRGKDRTITLGCYAADSHEVVDQHVCLVQDAELSRLAWCIREWARSSGFTAYNEKNGQGILRHLLLRKGSGTGEILVCLVTNAGRPSGSRNFANTLLEAAGHALKGSRSTIVGIVQNVNMRRTNVVLGGQEHTWWGRPFLFETLGELRFAVGASTFFQVNPFQAPFLYNEVLRWIDRGVKVLDLYCGLGTISIWVAQKARLVTGIDENAVSIVTAGKTAEKNRVRNVRFMKGAAEELFPDLLLRDFDVAVFDPPRKGLESAMLKALAASSLKRIIYVSCNPQSLARDVRELAPAWGIVSIQGVDMFPHTSHLETVVVLDKK